MGPAVGPGVAVGAGVDDESPWIWELEGNFHNVGTFETFKLE
jgi:hypothetical protein